MMNKRKLCIEKGINPPSFYEEKPAWRLSSLDRDDKWAIGRFNKDFENYIFKNLKIMKI